MHCCHFFVTPPWVTSSTTVENFLTFYSLFSTYAITLFVFNDKHFGLIHSSSAKSLSSAYFVLFHSFMSLSPFRRAFFIEICSRCVFYKKISCKRGLNEAFYEHFRLFFSFCAKIIMNFYVKSMKPFKCGELEVSWKFPVTWGDI